MQKLIIANIIFLIFFSLISFFATVSVTREFKLHFKLIIPSTNYLLFLPFAENKVKCSKIALRLLLVTLDDAHFCLMSM